MRLAEGDPVRTAALLILTMAGCTGDLVDLRDMAMNGMEDMTSTSDMAGMTGSDASMQSVVFIPTIESDITTLGCPGCHNGTQIPILKGTGNEDADYTSFTAVANTGASSPALIQNLAVAAGGNAAHPIHPFNDTNDTTYQRWLTWISAGNPKGP
jgi:hypothetical protein